MSGGLLDEAPQAQLPPNPSGTVAPGPHLTVVPDPPIDPEQLSIPAVRARFVAVVHKCPQKRDEILELFKDLKINTIDDATPEHLERIVRALPRIEREAQEYATEEADRKLRPYRDATGGVGK